MKLKITSSDFRKVAIFVGFFLITIANVMIFDKAKYLGLVLILLLAYIDVFKYGINKKDLLYIIGFCFLFMIEIPFQNLSGKKIISSIFYYFVLLTMIILGKNILKTGKEFFICMLGILTANLIGFIFSPALLAQQISGIGSRIRIYGSFSHPNALGSIIMICLLSGIIYLSTIEMISKKEKIISFFICITLWIQVMLTDSRGYQILFLIIIMIYLLKLNTNINILGKYLIFCLVSIASIYFIYFFWNYYANQDASYTSRLLGLKNLNLTGIRYWVGYGMVSSSEIDYSILDGGSMEIAWVKMFYKVGIIGVMLFILLLLKVFFNVVKIKNSKIRYAFYATYISFLIGSLVESSLVTIFNANPIFIWISLGAIPYLEKRRLNI